MSDFTKLSKLMKQDWDRRVSHDYRFWMSDGYSSDEAMWESGQRDFEIITQGIPALEKKTILELGCGVGRILRAAAKKCERVIGVDVSQKAIDHARQFLAGSPNVELIACNGYDLSAVPAGSVDLIFSFAALTSIPTDVAANYLHECNRTLKNSGVLRLQVYLGKEQTVEATDTLHLRCYDKENFVRAVTACGLCVESIEELILPIQVSFKELGIEACMVSISKVGPPEATSAAISKLLLPGGEKATMVIPGEDNREAESGSELEGWMALKYAEELAALGDDDRARATLEYVERYCRNMAIDTSDILERITKKAVGGATRVDDPPIADQNWSPELFEQNMRILSERFPAAYGRVVTYKPTPGWTELKPSSEGPILFFDGNCLDHPSKPCTAAATWAQKLLSEQRFSEAASLIVYGFGCGYHLEQLLRRHEKHVSVIEPHLDVFHAACGARDLGEVLTKLTGLEIGEVPKADVLDAKAELVVRPQSQITAPSHCSELRSRFYGTRGLTALHPKIAVLGPLQGGTLPIGAYCTRALTDLKQRNRFYDMSGFAPGYHLFDNFIFDKLRQATAHGHYIEMLSQLVLDSASEKPIDILICMAQAPLSMRALHELRNRGVITVLWFVEDYLRFTYWRQISSCFDFVFTIQRGACLDEIKAAGAGEVHYLPVGCEPLLHAPVQLTAEEKKRWGSPISFVGAGYHNRQQMFASLTNLPFKIWGTEWPECRPFDRLVQERGRRIAPEEYVRIFNASDININLHSSTERDGVDPSGDFVNPRTFEIAAAGGFQLVDERALLSELFEPGREVVTFSSGADLKEKIEYYLNHPEERRQIAAAGRARALRDHTYQNRLRAMLSIIYSSKFEELKRRGESGSWARMLHRAKPHEELSRRCQCAFERGEEPTLDGLVADIVTGKGRLSETEQKLLFLHHLRKQIIRMTAEEAGGK